MANQRSSNSRLLAIGFAVLVVGVLLVLVIIRNAGDDPVEPSPVATGQDTGTTDQPTEAQTPLTPEQLSTARLPLPLDIPEGAEALAVRLDFARSVAAIPAPGDRVNVYRYLSASVPAPEPGADDPAEPSTTAGATLPEPGPDSELVMPDMEVLAVTGPLPSANDGTLTVVLAVPSEDVPSLMPLADDRQLWFTLLPSADATEEPTESDTAGTEEPS